jgi:hypothetical protein
VKWHVLFLAIFASLAFALWLHHGAIGFTWDEGTDTRIVQCIRSTKDPFACTEDISQTRFPFYVHALAESFVPPYFVSIAFSLATLALLYAFAFREFGPATALLTAALYATSPQLLASGRMVLTHSNVILTTFTTCALLAAFEYARTKRFRWLAGCAIACGLTAASSIVGVMTGVILLVFYFWSARPRVRDLWFFPIAAVTFFAATIIYVNPANLRVLVDLTLHHPGEFSDWNYLDLGSNRAPWFYSYVLLVVKVGFWWIAAALLGSLYYFKRERDLKTKFLASFAIGLLLVLLLRSAVFHYDTPHHQAPLYPMLFLFIAAVLTHAARRWRAEVITAVVLFLIVQLRYDFMFFPNYLFYGSQYGDRFIGEFYGPASIHGQGRDPVWRQIDEIVKKNPNIRILVEDHNIFERSGANYVPFTQRDPAVRYEYALVDRLYARHFRYPERDAYNAYLSAEGYAPAFETVWPPDDWVYRIMRLPQTR